MNAIMPDRLQRATRVDAIRVLMVDDSVVVRSVVQRILEDQADIELVCTAGHLNDAYAYLADQAVDIVLLDHEMPGQKGLDALPEMLKSTRDGHVIMLSSHCQRGSKIAVAALSLGASDAIAKPASGEAGAGFASQLLSRIRRLAAARRYRLSENAPIALRPLPENFRATCIGIGASTGGIHALADLLGALEGRPDVPILVTQHLPAQFMAHYARQVARMTNLPVSVARDGDDLLPAHVTIAPGDASLSCRRDGERIRIALTDAHDPHSMARPSVNLMFDGMARSFGAGALGIVLTGIGRDGTAGGQEIVRQGGAILAQDRASSTIWGMPSSVAREGLASDMLPPTEMGRYLRDVCGVEW